MRPWNRPTRTGANAAIYVDGAAATGRVTPQTLASTLEPLVFGSSDASGFIGSIDEAAIYRTALSAARILAHYQAR